LEWRPLYGRAQLGFWSTRPLRALVGLLGDIITLTDLHTAGVSPETLRAWPIAEYASDDNEPYWLVSDIEATFRDLS
jgi:hypothetical protein